MSTLDDSDIPDLVLETIFGFLAEILPMEKWSEIRVVSKRWALISKPIFKASAWRAWPKFILPKNRSTVRNCSSRGDDDEEEGGEEKEKETQTQQSSLIFNADRTVVTNTVDLSCYRWALVNPVPLSDVVQTGKPLSITFVPSCS